MMYKIEYGLYNIIHEGLCKGRIFINASNVKQAQFRASQIAHSLFFCKRMKTALGFLAKRKFMKK